jgi:hypothetical protein
MKTCDEGIQLLSPKGETLFPGGVVDCSRGEAGSGGMDGCVKDVTLF